MSDDLVLTVPEVLRATYAVPTAVPPAGRAAFLEAVLDGLPEPVDEVAEALLETGRLTVVEHPVRAVRALDDDLLDVAVAGAAPPQRAQLRSATHAILVEAWGRPGSAGPLWGSAAVAAGVAERLGAPVLDVGGRQVLGAGRLLDALPGADGLVRLVDWVHVLCSPGAGGLRYTTRGLRRFGLPELQTEGVPVGLAPAWGSVLNGLASVLARSWWTLLEDPGHEPAFVTLPAQVRVRAADVLRAHGHRVAVGAAGVPEEAALVRLRLDPDPEADSYLTVLPPHGHGGSVADFLAGVAATVLGVPGRGGRVA